MKQQVDHARVARSFECVEHWMVERFDDVVRKLLPVVAADQIFDVEADHAIHRCTNVRVRGAIAQKQTVIRCWQHHTHTHTQHTYC